MARRKDMTMTNENYPGFEADLGNGAPVTLGDLIHQVDAGIDLQRAARFDTTGNMELDRDHREVFATVRGKPNATYWVTGVRLIAEEDGTRSLAGAIELILEDGDDAQQRALDDRLRTQADMLVSRLATELAFIAADHRGTGVPHEEFKPLARGILKASGPELSVPSDLAEFI